MSSTMLIVDDHPEFCALARAFLEAEGVQVVGEAHTGAEAVACAARLRPQVALVDVHLPDFDGFEVARRLRRLEEPPEVVLTSSRAACDFGELVGASGARGFVAKDQLSRSSILALLP